MHHGAVGIELGSGVARVVGKFFDQVFVGVAEFIFGHVGHRQGAGGKVFDKIFQRGIG